MGCPTCICRSRHPEGSVAPEELPVSGRNWIALVSLPRRLQPQWRRALLDCSVGRFGPSFPSAQTSTTSFSNVPMSPIVMRTTSPAAKVNESGGTTPVPVSSTAPCVNS